MFNENPRKAELYDTSYFESELSVLDIHFLFRKQNLFGETLYIKPESLYHSTGKLQSTFMVTRSEKI